MQSWKKQHISTVIVLAVVGALLILISLQYYWVAQVSNGERERMEANLRIGAARLQEDFDRELARAYLTFQISADTVDARDWERYARRYKHWNATAPYPQIVKNVYLVEVNQIGRLRFNEFDRADGMFKPAPWPNQLYTVRQGFEQAYQSTSDAGITAEYIPEAIVEGGSALVIPSSRRWTDSERREFDINADILFAERVYRRPIQGCVPCGSVASDATVFSYTIVTLDQVYITQGLIPALARQHLATNGLLDYNLTITSRTDPGEVIYRSGKQQANAPVAGDITINLFSVNFDELNNLLLTSRLPPEDDTETGGERIAIGIFGSPLDDEVRADSTGRDDAARWQLTLTHAAGSLDLAVDRLRTRNQLISIGAVLILLAAIGTLLITTRRAQRLADQQLAFAASVSHELRTPLAVIRSAGDNLADGVVHDLSRAQRYGELIRTESQRLSEMVEQALEFSAQQAGGRAYDLQPISINDVLESAISSVRPQLRVGGFAFKEAIQPDLPQINGDSAALRRVMLNLLGNAIKYSDVRRSISVSAQLSTSDDRPEVVIVVRDQGVGIAPDDIPHIFEPFYRGEAKATEVHGSGLGLSLVSHIVTAHGGQINVTSMPGRGSTFTIQLPALVDPTELPNHTQTGAYEQAYTSGRG